MLAGAADTSASGAGRNVLILQSFGSSFEPYTFVSSSFRSGVAESLRGPVEFHEISLESARGDDRGAEGPLADYLVALLKDRPPDLVAPIGGPASRFALSQRQRLFPTQPMLIVGADQRLLPADALGANEAAVCSAHDPRALVEGILRVLPGTEDVAVVIGSSPLERFWRQQIEHDLRPLASRVRLQWWDDLSFEEMLARAANLPPRSAIFYALLIVDAAGVSHPYRGALTTLHSVAHAPIFGLYEGQLGGGIVGGPLMSEAEIAGRSATAAVSILHGEPPASKRFPAVTPGPPVFDWRELERWGIRERDLPPGSTVRFRPPPVWKTYPGVIFGGLSLIAVLSAFVIGLLVHRARRRLAEQEVRALSRRLLKASEDERRRVARELHDDLAQRLARLAIDAARLDSRGSATPGGGDLGSMRAEIVRLSSDVHTLSRRLHPSVLDNLGLPEALSAEAERFSESESIAVELRLVELPQKPSSDAALCLYRIAQEALQNVARHAGAGRVEISLHTANGGCELEVSDNGVGFDPDEKRGGQSLGHVSMRERMHLVGGRLTIQSAHGRGTSVVAWVPLRGEEP
jgi:signal transduction histidine kinase